MIQYAGLSEINGPLVCLEGAKGVSYDEIAEITSEHMRTRSHLVKGKKNDD